LQILQNPKYTSDLNEQLTAKISGMIQIALDVLSKQPKLGDTLDQTIETETSAKLRYKMSNKDELCSQRSLRSSRYKNSSEYEVDKVSLRNSLKSLDSKKLK